MIKCPLCGWNNHESTQLCVSCGGDLENRSGLVREDENCYSFTPPRRIIDKGVGVTGSGNDLVFRFGSTWGVVLLIVTKLLLLGAYPYGIVRLYREENSLFYVLIPLTLLSALELCGWILLARGSRKKKRRSVGFGLRLLYAFHAIAMAYCILTMLIVVYFAVAVGFSWNLDISLGPALDIISSEFTMGLLVSIIGALLFFVIFLNICAKFFHYTHDIFTRNSIKFYPMTTVIAVVFVLMTVLGAAVMMLVIFRNFALGLMPDFQLMSLLVSRFAQEDWGLVFAVITLFTISAGISAAMAIGYIRSYRSLFVKN